METTIIVMIAIVFFTIGTYSIIQDIKFNRKVCKYYNRMIQMSTQDDVAVSFVCEECCEITCRYSIECPYAVVYGEPECPFGNKAKWRVKK